MPEWLSHYDVYLFTSCGPEALARTVMEAMAAGLLVIGAETGGQVEMFDNGKNALTFKAEDAHGLADQIEHVSTILPSVNDSPRPDKLLVLERFTLDRMLDNSKYGWGRYCESAAFERLRFAPGRHRTILQRLAAALHAVGHESHLIYFTADRAERMMPGTHIALPAWPTSIDATITRSIVSSRSFNPMWPICTSRGILLWWPGGQRLPTVAFVHAPYVACPGSAKYLRNSGQVCEHRAGAVSSGMVRCSIAAGDAIRCAICAHCN